jgi:acyl-CoA thioesterase-1
MDAMSTRLTVYIIVLVILILSVTIIAQSLQPALVSKPNLSRIALLGDSLTEITHYPSDLQALLKTNSTVGNFGDIGATVTLSSINPYIFHNASHQAKDFQPTTVIIMLGTNDARLDVYPGIESFVDDYKLLISQFQYLESKPQIFLVIPPPVYNNSININGTNFASVVVPKIEQVASELDLPLIDCYTPLLGHPDYFVDGVHLNEKGSNVIANTIYKYITSENV